MRKYEIYEKTFYSDACKRLGKKLEGLFGVYFEVIKYKGKNYYFKVACNPIDRSCDIYWTTETFGWAQNDS